MKRRPGRPKLDPHAGVRVEWWSGTARDWVGIGPWFQTEVEAREFAGTVNPLGRAVRIRRCRPAQLELAGEGL